MSTEKIIIKNQSIKDIGFDLLGGTLEEVIEKLNNEKKLALEDGWTNITIGPTYNYDISYILTLKGDRLETDEQYIERMRIVKLEKAREQKRLEECQKNELKQLKRLSEKYKIPLPEKVANLINSPVDIK